MGNYVNRSNNTSQIHHGQLNDNNQINTNTMAQQDPLQIQDQAVEQARAFRQKLYGRWAEDTANMPKSRSEIRMAGGNAEGQAFNLLSAGFSSTLLSSLEELEADRGTASKQFFEPVLIKARALVRFSDNDAACATHLA